jgi:hypothetical protein
VWCCFLAGNSTVRWVRIVKRNLGAVAMVRMVVLPPGRALSGEPHSKEVCGDRGIGHTVG